MRQHTIRTVAAMAAAVVLSLAACGGGDDDSSPTTPEVPPAETPAPAAPEAPAGSTITISGFAFSGVTEVPVGTTVVVTNADSATHTWTATDGTFDSSSIAPGESFEFTFTEPGTFDYFCNFHPSMAGTITVTG